MPGNRPNSEALMLRGSLFTFRRRCGKPNCRCASGEPHESPALSYLEAGKTKTLTLTGADLDEVRSALARYNEAKAELERRADAGVAALRARLGSSRGRQRR